MQINGIQGKSYAAQTRKKRSAKKTAPLGKAGGARRRKDTVELSGTSEASKAREAHLAAIRKKIDGGFYNSGEVVEDLSDSFAKAFDQALK
jgi:anti-sigma28 factor (negative regulator of flagellin synthesis)